MLSSFFICLLLVTFLLSGIAKIVGFEEFKHTIKELELHERLVFPSAIAVVLLECAISAMLLFPQMQGMAYILIFLLLAAFTWSIYRAYTRQLRVACNCFGNLNPELFGWNTVLRVIMLFVVTLYLFSMGTKTVWADYPYEDIFYAGVGSIGVLLVYSLLPYAAFGTAVSDGSKKKGGA